MRGGDKRDADTHIYKHSYLFNAKDFKKVKLLRSHDHFCSENKK